MLFTSDAHDGLADGSITVTFRSWKRPQVRVGGRYRVGPVVLEVDTLAEVRVAALTEDDARRAGFADRKALLGRLGDPDDGVVVWRVEFHTTGEAPAAAPVLEKIEVLRRLDRLDSQGAEPWTTAVLLLIAERPATVSTELARELGRERMAFKADVRKLKRLGLTDSLEVGYRLTPLGQSVLRALDARR